MPASAYTPSDDLYFTEGQNTSNSNDIDEEDYADQLSPSDGYFASGRAAAPASSNVAAHNVPNVMVPDPTVRDSDVEETNKHEAKALQARQESLLNSTARGDSQPQALSARDFIESQLQRSAPSTRSDSTTYNNLPPLPTPPTSYAPSSSTSTSHPITASSTSRQQYRPSPGPGRTPSLYSEAPPAYTPSHTTATTATTATTPLSPSRETNQTSNYGSISPPTSSPASPPPNMGIENERLLGRDPESMGEPGEEPLYSPRWSKRIRRRFPWLNWKIALFALVLLVVTFGFLMSGYKAVKGDSGKTIRPTLPEEGNTPPSEPSSPEPSNPAQPGSPAQDPFVSTYCQDAKYRFPDQIMAVEFNKDKNLTFVQGMTSHSGNMNVRVGGQVNLRKLDDGGIPRVVVELLTNDDLLRLDSYINENDQMMSIHVPKRKLSDNTEEGPCLEIRATIWVPEDAELQQLAVGTVHLDILTLGDLSIKINEMTKFSSTLGEVSSGVAKPKTYDNPEGLKSDAPDFTFIPAPDSYVFDSRIIELYSTTGSIDGNWPLYDMLGIHTTSGSIMASITPKPVLESDPKPAVLSLSSVSGTIHANEPIHEEKNIPIRDYLVDIKSTSGGMHCALAFGRGIELKSTASDIAVDLLPVLDSDVLSPSAPAQLETVTTSGATAVRILDPIWFGNKSSSAAAKADFNCLQAIHKSTSANIGLRYPQSWIGDIHADTTSGSLAVKGKDVRVTRSGGGWPGSTLSAYKGKSGGGSTITVKTMLGNLDAVLGDE
ncbi:hypothetical protein G7054_g13763 [Neopestalotiopsis clavispora]|nr:hypothetical protein G7054_g13763 [Neopestalotiopsis clavispora]